MEFRIFAQRFWLNSPGFTSCVVIGRKEPKDSVEDTLRRAASSSLEPGGGTPKCGALCHTLEARGPTSTAPGVRHVEAPEPCGDTWSQVNNTW